MPNEGEQFERLRAALASRYHILSRAGSGGSAAVYLAEDLKHDRQVAIKVLRPEMAAAIGAQRFLREIQIAAHLAHPHILPLHDSGEADGFLYYVMPYVPGESLRDRLGREHQLPISEAVQIVREVADALGYAHSLGFVHRDIKPENILFMGGHAVVADFGVAAITGTVAGTRLTETGMAVGTPLYMSPEQVTGQGDLDGRSDIYSLGCVLYEMLAGEPPFSAPNAQAVLARKLSEPVPLLTDTRASVSPGLESVLRRALASLPADRFTTAGEFAAAVTQEDSSAARPPDAERRADHATGQHDAQTRRTLIITAGVLALLLATVTWSLQGGDGQWLRDRTAGPADPGTQQLTTIAVLPFENLGPPADAYFAAGMSDEITSRLGSVKALGLVPRRAAQRHARADRTMREIGQELGVDYLLLGSVRWAGSDTNSGNVRITLELLRARDERQLWSTTYDRAIDNLFEVQSDIAEQVIQRLGVGLPEGGRSRAGYHPTENREAYLLYLKGRYFWAKRTEEDIETGLTYFQQATDLDPTYAKAWAGIADIWIFRGWYSRLAPRETFPKALASVQRALALDSTLAEAHASLAHIHLEFDHDWAAAEQEYLRAIALDPSYPTAHHWYGGYLSAMGRHDEALQQAETARSLDPMSLIIQTWMGLRYYLARNNEKAIAEYRKALALNPDFAPAHWHLGWAYEEASRFKEAIAEAERAVALDQGNLVYLSSLGHAYASAGMKKEARDVLARLEEASTSRHVSAYHTAAIDVALGDTAAALDWLARAYDEQSPWIGYLAVDPRFDPVRSQPRFKEVLRKARLMQ